jgi:hypothetical protein
MKRATLFVLSLALALAAVISFSEGPALALTCEEVCWQEAFQCQQSCQGQGLWCRQQCTLDYQDCLAACP